MSIDCFIFSLIYSGDELLFFLISAVAVFCHWPGIFPTFELPITDLMDFLVVASFDRPLNVLSDLMTFASALKLFDHIHQSFWP